MSTEIDDAKQFLAGLYKPGSRRNVLGGVEIELNTSLLEGPYTGVTPAEMHDRVSRAAHKVFGAGTYRLSNGFSVGHSRERWGVNITVTDRDTVPVLDSMLAMVRQV